MIADQLKKIKKDQKSIMGKSNTEICFTGLHDVENETLLDLIPITSKYTTKQSLHFDRFRLSIEQEAKFNLKFSTFLMDLVKYSDTPDIEYLYDFLVRRYHVQKFNPKEFIFVILLSREFYPQLRKVDRYSSLQWFDNQEDYSTYYIADLCIKDRTFFSLFVHYYQYYQYEKVQKFVDEITNLIIQKTGTNIIKFVTFFYEIIATLVENEHRKKAVDLFIKVKPFIGENTSDFDEILGDIESDITTGDVQNISKPQIIDNAAIEEMFCKASQSSDGRKYLKDSRYLIKYMSYLTINNYKDESFTKDELEFLKNESPEGKIPIEELRNLLKDIDDQDIIIHKFLKYPLDDFIKIIEDVNHDQWKIVLEKHPSTFKHFINLNNYREMVTVLHKHKDYPIDDFTKHCIENHFLEIPFIESILTKEMILEYINTAIQTNNTKSLSGLLTIAYQRRFLISKNMIDGEFYKLPLVFDFIAKEVKRTFDTTPPYDSFLYNLSDERYLHFIEENLISGINLSVIYMICDAKKSSVLTNKIVIYVIENSLFSDIFIEFVDRNLKDITTENIRRFFTSYGYKQEIYKIIEKAVVCQPTNNDITNTESQATNIDNELVKSIYQEEGYYVLYRLASFYGFNLILGSLSEKDRRDCLLYIYRLQVLNSENIIDYLLYLSNNSEMNDKEILGIFIKEYEHLIGLKKSKNWCFIKIIIIEGLKQENAQDMFETFFKKCDLYENDSDLLESITSFPIDLNREIVDDSGMTILLNDFIFNSLKSNRNIDVADILIRKLSYHDIRIIPFVVPGLIKRRMSSVVVFFTQYKNIMAPYIKNVLEEYPEIYESLYHIDSKIIILKIIEMCRKRKEINELENRILEFGLKKTELSEEQYLAVTNVFIENAGQVSLGCFNNLLTKYKNQKAIDLLDLLYKTQYDIFIEIAPSTVKIMPNEYKTYISSIITKDNLSLKEYKFIAEYLKYQSRDADVSGIISNFDKFVDLYLNSEDRCIARVISRSLNYVKDKTFYTKKLLNLLKEPHTVLILRLFQSIVRNTDNYKKQIPLITPHLSLLVDSTKEQISLECHKFLDAVEKQYGFNPMID